MSDERPPKPQNGKNDELNGSKSSEKYRSNSDSNGSLNLNSRPLGVNAKLTFGNRSSTSRDSRASRNDTPCRCVDRRELGASASHCSSCRGRVGNSFDSGLMPLSSSNPAHQAFKNPNKQHQLENIHKSSYSQQFGLRTGTRPKQRYSSDSGSDFSGMSNYKVSPYVTSPESHVPDPIAYPGSFGNGNQRYDDVITQEELEIILSNAPCSASSRGECNISCPAGDISKESDNAYDLNGLKLSREELAFVLNQSSASDFGAPTFSNDGHDGTRNENFINLDTPRRKENISRLPAFQQTDNGSSRQMIFRRQPVSSAEKLLTSCSLELLELPWAEDEDISKCPICLGNLQNDSPAQTSTHASRGLVGAVMLSNCGHAFHCCCLLPLLTTAAQSFSCPLCRTVHGAVTGTQPSGGTMSASLEPTSLPGFQTTQTIVILYNLPEGVQGPGHPHPGQPYHLKGFPRKAYLPDTPKGRQVASLLKKAFDRRLVFTVGHSESVGLDDCVIWGNISHKTLVKDRKFGYPDPYYLDNVMLELAALGIHENC